VVLALIAVLLGNLVPGLPDRNAVPVAEVTPDGTATATPTPTPAPEASPTPEAPRSSVASTPPKSTPEPVVPRHGPGTYNRATATLVNQKERGTVIRYTVQVEKGVPVDPDEAAAIIHGVLNDKRSWGGKGAYTWIYVPKGRVDLTASIVTPDTTDKICAPLNTRGELSCRNGGRIALNADRWVYGVKHYGGDLTGYRQYLVNHEFGHYLGHGHEPCPGKGKRAPVMMTQTVGLEGCVKNPWPANDP